MSQIILQAILLAGAVVWGVAGVLPLWRRIFKSPGGWAFSLMAFALAVYLFMDSLRVGATTAEGALLLFRLSAILVSFVPLLFLLFAKWIGLQRRRLDLLLALPTLPVALLVFFALSSSAYLGPWGFVPERNPVVFAVWLAYLFGYSVAALYFLWRGARKFRGIADREYVIFTAINSSLAAVLIAGAIVLISMGESGSPLVSSVLLVPGIVLTLFLAPVTPELLNGFLRKATRARREILHAFLIYHGGSLIASRSLDGHSLPDEDIFSAVLEAIQRFMNVSLPVLHGRWLDAIVHGDLKILTERGRHCFLVLVTTGREDDLLRGEMMDVLRRFEERNSSALAKWDGDVSSMTDATAAVDLFFDLDQVF